MLHVGGVESGTDLAENLLYGSGAEGSFAEHIFVTRFCMKLYYSDACAFLAAVVLFLHHQIELVEGVGVGAVLLFVVLKRVAQPYECYATFVLEWFHQRMKRSSRYLGRGQISLSTISSSLSM